VKYSARSHKISEDRSKINGLCVKVASAKWWLVKNGTIDQTSQQRDQEMK